MSYGDIEVFDLDSVLDAYLRGNRKTHFPSSLHYTEGTKNLHLRQYERALSNFNSVLDKDPSDVKALMKRCKAYQGLLQYENAREDAAAALRLLPGFSEAFNLMGQSKYLMGDLEGGYMTYLKGRQAKPVSDRLRMGQQLCEEAMGNSMHLKSGMTIGEQDIKLLRQTRTGNQKLAKMVPCEFFNYERFTEDKKIFEELLSDEDLKSVHGICREGLDVIKNNQRVGAMQVPIYARRRVPAPRRQAARRSSVLQYVTSVRNRCEYYLRKGSENLCIAEGQKLIEIIESRPELTLQQKMKLEADVLHLLGLAYAKGNKESLCIDHIEKELEIAQMFGLVIAEIRALRCVGEHYLKYGIVSGAGHCFRGLLEALNSKRLEKFLKEQNKTPTNKMAETKELVEIQEADLWIRKFKSKIKSSIRNSIIIPVKYLLHEAYQMHEEMRSLETDSISRSFASSESDDSEYYYTVDGTSDSEMSSQM